MKYKKGFSGIEILLFVGVLAVLGIGTGVLAIGDDEPCSVDSRNPNCTCLSDEIRVQERFWEWSCALRPEGVADVALPITDWAEGIAYAESVVGNNIECVAYRHPLRGDFNFVKLLDDEQARTATIECATATGNGAYLFKFYTETGCVIEQLCEEGSDIGSGASCNPNIMFDKDSGVCPLQ